VGYISHSKWVGPQRHQLHFYLSRLELHSFSFVSRPSSRAGKLKREESLAKLDTRLTSKVERR